MRLFAAVPLSAAAHAAAAETLRGLKALDWPVRWVREDGLHITLKFFGEVLAERFDIIAELVQFAVAGMAPIELAVRGAGVYPDFDRPKVIRLDLDPLGHELELLQDRLEHRGLEIGFAPEGRPFHPHITLGRVKEGQRLPATAPAVLEAVARQPGFLADRVTLYESLSTPEGPRYDPRLELTLAG